MPKYIAALGTNHQIQGLEKHPDRGLKIEDPTYALVVEMMIKSKGIDLIFEEASGLGPSTASVIGSRLGLARWVDIDPNKDERHQLEISVEEDPQWACEPQHGLEPMYWHKLEGQQKRENVWLQRIEQYEFQRALLICGMNHMFSISFRLVAEGFEVETGYYEPRRLICERLRALGLA